MTKYSDMEKYYSEIAEGIKPK
jgi:hypothetical protein